MARISKEYDERKNEILDTAQRLFYEKGYEQTSINAIIGEIGVSKGAFYYYFDSKENLLDSLVDRSALAISELIDEVLDNDDLDSIEKLNRVFTVSGMWKSKNIDFIKAYIKVIYDEKNMLLLYKMQSKNVEIMAPVFSKIIKQGMAEGKMDTPFPDDVGKLLMMVGNDIGRITSKHLLEIDENPQSIEPLLKTFLLYENIIERILGIEEGELGISSISKEILRKMMSK